MQPLSRFVPGTPRLHFLEWNPAGIRTLVVLHGNCANAWWWQPTADALASADFRLIALDLRGHGDSEWVRPPRYAPADYADDLARVIAAVGADRPIAVGHSMGGMALLASLVRYPDLVNGAVVADSAITSGPRRNHYLRRLRSLPTIAYPDLATARSRFRFMPNEGSISPELLASIAELSIQRTVDGRYTMKFDRETFSGTDGIDAASVIRSARIPLMLVRGELSRIMTAEAAVAAARSNPLVQLVTISGAHHHLPLESPTPLARAIEQFVAGH